MSAVHTYTLTWVTPTDGEQCVVVFETNSVPIVREKHVVTFEKGSDAAARRHVDKILRGDENATDVTLTRTIPLHPTD